MNPHVLRHLCQLADDKISSRACDSLQVAKLCCRLGARLGTAEARARGFAQLTTALCIVCDRPHHAEQAIEVALVAAPTYLQGDLLRRRSITRIYQRRFLEALQDAESAVERTVGREHAVALQVLGAVHYYRGDSRAAIHTCARALAKTDPSAETLFCLALQNYATALAQGTNQEATTALELCAEVRTRLKDRHRIHRARLWWTEGLLHKRLGDHQTAWWSLDVARRSLIALQAAPELAAIVADMAKLSPQPAAVQHLCFEAADVITAPHPLAKPLRTLESAASNAILEAAAALHGAASCFAPCPAL